MNTQYLKIKILYILNSVWHPLDILILNLNNNAVLYIIWTVFLIYFNSKYINSHSKISVNISFPYFTKKNKYFYSIVLYVNNLIVVWK